MVILTVMSDFFPQIHLQRNVDHAFENSQLDIIKQQEENMQDCACTHKCVHLKERVN